MSFSDEGNGIPLVLVHGFTRTAASHWKPRDRQVFSRWRTIIPDLRGHGNSTNNGQPLSHQQFALDLIALCEELDIRKAHFAGFSSGGMCLYDLAGIAPQLMISMTVISAGTRIPESTRETMRVLTDPNRNPDYSRTCRELDNLHEGGQGKDYGRKILDHWFRLTNPPGDPNRTDNQLRAISVPTLIIHGDRDPFFPMTQAQQAHDLIPDSQLVLLENCGHFVPSPMLHQQVFPAILEFLPAVESRS